MLRYHHQYNHDSPETKLDAELAIAQTLDKLAEKAFSLTMLEDDRAIAATYIMGNLHPSN